MAEPTRRDLEAENAQLRRENELLRQELEQLRAEMNRLKGLPELPRRPPQASTLNDPEGLPSARKKKQKRRGGKRPGSAKRVKTGQLTIHETVRLDIDNLPEGSEFRGYQDFTVQDLRIEVFNTRYRRARYRLPDGSFSTAAMPESVRSHFGPTLRQYVLYQHFHNQVTQPLLLDELREMGVEISAGTISAMLTEGHELFHQEKESLLPAAREASRVLQTDDTSARHCGEPGHTLQIGNDFFATFFTTETKSRVNFLKCLRTPFTDYVLNLDALFYLEHFAVSRRLLARLRPDAEAWRVFDGEEAWERQLAEWEPTAEQGRLITEAALWASLLSHDLYQDTILISDDAAQFKLFAFLHGLCWLHQERHITQLIPLNTSERQAHERIRDAIWKYYQRLKAYRQSPTARRRGRLETDFDRLFLQRTGWPELDEALQKISARKDQLLLVLEYPEMPLHNNLSENDIRQYVKKRKISAGTRSDAGRRARDTFLSLKTTCRKLRQSFWRYLQDRIQGLGRIPPLGELIRAKAAQAHA